MRKLFAFGDSSGPDITNLQLSFWRLAVRQFDEILETWKAAPINDPLLCSYQHFRTVAGACMEL